MIIGLLVPAPDDEKKSGDQAATASATSTPASTGTATQTATTAATRAPEPTAPQPSPRTVTGTGQEVKSVRVRADGPMVVSATHEGQENFIVDLVPRGGGGSENLFNEIGSYDGDTLVEDAATGRYRLRVEADGPWKLRFSQPVPTDDAKKLPRTVRGNGAEVVAVRTSEDLQPVVHATHRGQANFIVDIVGYGSTSGSENLFNEIGNFSGETLLNDLPEGGYLLHVQADGRWTVRVSND